MTLARPRVLVVDDERYNRELVQRTLARYADVLVACDLDEALAACAAVAVDVLITDQRLGAGTGTELAARVRAAAPQTRIVLIHVGKCAGSEGVLSSDLTASLSTSGVWSSHALLTKAAVASVSPIARCRLNPLNRCREMMASRP